MEDLHVTIIYLVFVFPLICVLFSRFGSHIGYQLSFVL